MKKKKKKKKNNTSSFLGGLPVFPNPTQRFPNGWSL
jgi:hypothetical protein